MFCGSDDTGSAAGAEDSPEIAARAAASLRADSGPEALVAGASTSSIHPLMLSTHEPDRPSAAVLEAEAGALAAAVAEATAVAAAV